MRLPPPTHSPSPLLLQALGQSLLRLHRLAKQTASERLLVEALENLRGLLPFRSAWWGECSPPTGGQAPANWQHGSIGLPASFAAEWNAVGGVDSFAQNSMAALDQVCRDSGYEIDAPPVRVFAQRHQLYHAMAITCAPPGSGLAFFVCLYRGEDQLAFDDLEALLFHQYVQHLRLCWGEVLQHTLRRSFASNARSTALCEASGQLLHIGADVAAALHNSYPGWQGSTLPAPLLALLARAPSTAALGRSKLAVQACGNLFALTLGSQGASATLTPREREAALLYAAGDSYKSIAKRLGLSPATVRTYLRDVYAQLGVRNKQELSAVLQPALRG